MIESLYVRHTAAHRELGQIEIELVKLARLLLGREEISVSIDFDVVSIYFTGQNLEEQALKLITNRFQAESGFSYVNLLWIPPIPKFKLFKLPSPRCSRSLACS